MVIKTDWPFSCSTVTLNGLIKLNIVFMYTLCDIGNPRCRFDVLLEMQMLWQAHPVNTYFIWSNAKR